MNLINANQRDNNISNSAKKARQKGCIPGILHSKKIQSMLFEVGDLEFNKELHCVGEHGILDIQLNGTKYKTLITEVQRDPVNKKVLHVDLESINENEKITSQVPIHYEGEELLQKRGQILQKEKETVKVECLASNLPKYFTLNVSNASIGDVYKMVNLEVGDEVSIVDDIQSILASISSEKIIPTDDLSETVDTSTNAVEK